MALGNRQSSSSTTTTITSTSGVPNLPGPDSASTIPDIGEGRPLENTSNGPKALTPAFILSALMVVGVVMMCWWKRLALQRARAAGVGPFSATSASVGTGVEGGRGVEIGPGRGLSTGMLMLAARGVELTTQIQTNIQVQEGLGGRRRKKEIKLGPRPVMWDVYLDLGEEKDSKEETEEREMRWEWRWMNPLSVSRIYHQQAVSANLQPDSSPYPIATSEPSPSTVERREFTPSTQNWRREDGTGSSDLPDSSSTEFRISMLISMPSPRRPTTTTTSPSAEDHRESGHRISSGSRSRLSSSSDDNQGERLGIGESEDTAERRGLSDHDIVLGIAEVPLRGVDEYRRGVS